MLPQRDIDAIKLSAAGFKRRLKSEDAAHMARLEELEKQPPLPQPEWELIDGVEVLRVPGGRYAAAPTSGKRGSSHFMGFDVQLREEICQLRKTEVRGWLIRTSQNTA